MQRYYCFVNSPFTSHFVITNHPVMAAMTYANDHMPIRFTNDLVKITVTEMSQAGKPMLPLYRIELQIDVTEGVYYPA